MFEKVKQALCVEPLLHKPNFSLPFLPQTDRPVLDISWKLSERESRYRAIEKECLAFRCAVGALRYYLLGWPFVLFRPHFKFRMVHKPGAQMTVADFLSHSHGEQWRYVEVSVVEARLRWRERWRALRA